MTRRKSAYTLIEVLVAVVILSIILPGLSYMVIGSRKAQISSYRMEQAAAYGQLVIDSLSILPPGARNATTRTATATIGGVNYTSTWFYTSQGIASLVTDTVKWAKGGKAEYIVIRGVVR